MSSIMPHIAIEELSAYIDQELSAAEYTTIQLHLQQCYVCLQTVRDLQGTKTLVHTLPVPSLPHSFAITPAMQGSYARVQRGIRVLQYAGSLAAVLGIFLLGSLFLPFATVSNTPLMQSATHTSSISPHTSAPSPGTGVSAIEARRTANLPSVSAPTITPEQSANLQAGTATASSNSTQASASFEWIFLPITRILLSIFLILGAAILWNRVWTN